MTPFIALHKYCCCFFFFFCTLKVCASLPTLSKFVDAIFPVTFANFTSLCHLLVSLEMFQTFRYYYICYHDLWSIIFDITPVVATDVTTDHCCYCKTHMTHCPLRDFPGGTSGKVSACQCKRRRRHGFDPWRRKWQANPLFLPGKSHGQRSLAGYSPWGCRVGHNWETEHAYVSFNSLI